MEIKIEYLYLIPTTMYLTELDNAPRESMSIFSGWSKWCRGVTVAALDVILAARALLRCVHKDRELSCIE